MKKIDKNKIARSFTRGHKTYDAHARIQRYVSLKLIDMLKNYRQISYDNVFEIGCCTGNLTELLLNNFNVQNLFLNDLVPGFYDDVVARIQDIRKVEIIPRFGDIETIDLPVNLDCVISSATFQWLVDLPLLFERIYKSLNTRGFLVFSIFGPGTLSEFKEVTGIGLEYMPVGVILDMLEKNFHIEEEQTVKDQLFFSTPREILKHLQMTGVGGVQEHRWTVSSLKEFEVQYSERFGGSSGVPVTYMSSYVIASKK